MLYSKTENASKRGWIKSALTDDVNAYYNDSAIHDDRTNFRA